MQRAYFNNCDWESTQTPRAKRLTMEAPLIPDPTPWPKGPCTPVCSKPLDYPTRQCFSGVGWNCRALGEHMLQMWGNCGSGNSHWAATLMPQALRLLYVVGGRGAWSIVGGEHVLKANPPPPMWWGSFLCEVPVFPFRGLKGWFFTVTQAKGCLHNSLDLASRLTSGLASGLTLHVWGWLPVTVETQLAKDAAVAGKAEVESLSLLPVVTCLFYGVDGETKQNLGRDKHCVDTELMP